MADPRLDWLIIGAGIHGTHLARKLIAEGVSRTRVALVDPNPVPMARWSRRCAAVGMRYLRSPGVHHIGLDPHELDRMGRPYEERLGPYARPSLDLFNRHAAQVVAAAGIGERVVKGYAEQIVPDGRGWRVQTTGGSITTRRVVLATGPAAPRWPEFARVLREEGAAIRHVLTPSGPRLHGRVAVVGAGMSAAQAALVRAAGTGPVPILVGPRPRIARFDSEPMWLGPRLVTAMRKTSDLAHRREMIRDGRCPGTITDEVASHLARAEAEGRLDTVGGRVVEAQRRRGGLRLVTDDGGEVSVDSVLLATGFERCRPGGALVDEAVQALDLPVAPCGWPIVGPELEWAPGLHVTGGLAELWVGAAAPNIAGARRCAEAIVTSHL